MTTTMNLTERHLLAEMVSNERGVCSITTGPPRTRTGRRTGKRDLLALSHLFERGYAVEIWREMDRDNVRGPRSRVGRFLTITAKITPEGRAAYERMVSR